MMGQDRVEYMLQVSGPLTYRQIVNKLVEEGENGNIEYSVIRALYGLRCSKRIDYTTPPKPERQRGANPRLYRAIK